MHALIPIFNLSSGVPLAMGGVWKSWRDPDGDFLRTCAVITTGPHEVMEPTHDRMPVIIAPEQVLKLLAPCPAAPYRPARWISG